MEQTRRLKLRQIEFCDRIRVRRRALDTQAVLRYKDAYEAGQVLPPLVVFNEPGTERYIVADGNHRLKALLEINAKTAECIIKEGDEVDAFRYALSCNGEHGLPRSKEDIEYAFRQLMDHPILSVELKTNQDKADALKVSLRTIQRYVALWRELEGGDEAAKRRARERAAGRTKTRIQTKPVADWDGNADGMTEAVEESHKIVSTHLTLDRSLWDIDDESAFSDLMDAWNDATVRAKAAFRKEISEAKDG